MTAPVLVTGAPRSGTTWVGQLLAAAEGVHVVHEPFNPDSRSLRRPVPRHFLRITEQTAAEWRPSVSRLLGYHRPTTGLRAARSKADVGRELRARRALASARRSGARLVLKDPIALFSADWLVREFEMMPLVVLRHPAGFASSLRRLGWRTDFRAWLDDDGLADLLHEMWGQVEQAADGVSMLEEAVVLYNACHAAIAQFTEGVGNSWTMIRYDDLVHDPPGGARRLAARLQLDFGDASVAAVQETLGGPAEVPVGEATRRRARNSVAASATWRQRLSPDEISFVRTATEQFASPWWGGADWACERALA